MGELNIKFIIENKLLEHLFQPIYHLRNNKIIGYEALIRCKLIDSPYALFQLAKTEAQLSYLDVYSISTAIQYFSEKGYFNKSNLLFLNIYPSTLLTPLFEQTIEKLLKSPNHNIQANKIVFEINESEEIENFCLVGEVISRLKQKGFLFAIDDFGSKGASLQRLVELEVDIIKLDRYFSKDLSNSINKQKIISLLLDYVKCKEKIILEGIESSTDIETSKNLGIQLGQGYLLGKPAKL